MNRTNQDLLQNSEDDLQPRKYHVWRNSDDSKREQVVFEAQAACVGDITRDVSCSQLTLTTIS